VEGRRDRGRPCARRLDGVKKAYHARSMKLSDAKVMCMDREMWMDFENGKNGGVNVQGVADNAFDAKK